MINAQKLKELIRSKGLTQDEFAKQIPLSKGGLQSIFKLGRTSQKSLDKIAELLGVHPGVLLIKKAEPKPYPVLDMSDSNEQDYDPYEMETMRKEVEMLRRENETLKELVITQKLLIQKLQGK